MTTAIAPIHSDVEFVQAPNGRPGSPSAGTCPDATAPIAQPRKNGMRTEASAKVAPSSRASAIVAASPRRANAAPRKMIPTAARKSGT